MSQTDKHAARTKIAHENITHYYPELIPRLAVAFHRAAFYRELLPATAPVPRRYATRFLVVSQDTLTCARSLVHAHGAERVAVLNMANHKRPGGGFLTGAGAQEEALCRRSTLFLHLTQTQGTLGKMYPFPKQVSAIWTPGVRVFRDEDTAHCAVWPERERFNVGVITAAAIQDPALDRTQQDFKFIEDVKRTKDKMAQVVRVFPLLFFSYESAHTISFGMGAATYCKDQWHHSPRIGCIWMRRIR
jgi:uncharacterized protein (TIGR02452 family)